ncbi:FUSC family protein [Asaia lannensis]|uniref:FUSC family protein n=1 Tax=Asaia lannensis NBRC 102526 TaxID=1307926 RepID=A0ABT1CHA7_9PROT|nr:FUSC family protein [Asaia lannensis]MCO6160245.1 FUSC family protein [Asaia lannensis NBRC 102526]GBQ94755.1 fusaric acid resistance protein [Asaia lannensis NBRC 102526]
MSGAQRALGTALRLTRPEPPSTFAFLRKEMAPAPGRMRNTLLLVAQVIVTILIGETFRIPDLPVLVFICFFLSGNDAASNTSTAVMGGAVIVAGTAFTIILLMASLSEPGLRLPLMLLLTLGAGFLSQAMTMGALANILLFWIVYMTMSADMLETVGYSLDGFIGNTTDSAMPDALFMPPEEAMLHVLLWVGAVFVISLVIMVIANRLAGHDPLMQLRGGLAARFEAVTQVCETGGRPDTKEAGAVLRLAEQGVALLRRFHDLSIKLHPELSQHHVGLAMIRTTARLVMIMVAWTRLYQPAGEVFLHRAGASLRSFFAAFSHTGDRSLVLDYDPSVLEREAESFRDDPKLYPIALELIRSLTIIHGLLIRPETTAASFAPEIKAAAQNFFKPDAFTNPAYPQAAIRIALSVVICYAITRFTSWPGIQTCVVTCFLVSLGTVGDSVHKMLLRVIGAMIGAFFGIGTILTLMPALTDCFDLILVVIPVALFAGWIKSGSERISYAGVQIAMAYFMTILQGYGPTLDMETARNRVVGILIGNVIVYLMAALLWPVSTTNVARRFLTGAVRQLGELVVIRRAHPEAAVDVGQEVEREKFGRAIAATRTSLMNAPFEEERLKASRFIPDITGKLVTDIQMLSIPVAVISDVRHPPDPAALDHVQSLRTWLGDFASWLDDGRRGEELQAMLPPPPELKHDPQRAAWFAILDTRLRQIIQRYDPEAQDEAEAA